MERENITHSFEPIYNKNSKILILGSFPSVKSRQIGFYYGHPQNRFWRLLACLYEANIPQTIDEKKAFLYKNHLALWDVIASCDIIGSQDSSIKNVVPTDIKQIIDNSTIENIFVNGKTAAKLYKKYQEKITQFKAQELPSTSPANAAYTMERLKKAWEIIKK